MTLSTLVPLITFVAMASTITIPGNATASTMCYDCAKVPYQRDCDYVTTCAPDMKCYTELVVTDSGQALYNSGCMSKTRCNQYRRSVYDDRVDLYDDKGDLVMCTECCDDDFCNVQGCGSPPLPSMPTRGPMCFNCHQQKGMDSCFSATVCDINELCSITSTVSGFGDVLYRTGCSSLKMQFKTNAEKAQYYKQRKKDKDKQRKLNHYKENSQKINSLKRIKRAGSTVAVPRAKLDSAQTSLNSLRMHKYRQKKETKKERNRRYQSEFKKRKSENESHTVDTPYTFKNRMEKLRLVRKIKQCIPGSPGKKAAILQSLAKPSKCSISYVDNIIVSNVKDMIRTLKKRRNGDALVCMNVLAASVSGENLVDSRTKGKTASRLGLRFSRVNAGYKKRTTVLTSERACLTDNSRKLRNDRLTDEIKEHVYKWWTAPQSSRPTGNKSDVKRKRTGYKTYLSHPVYVLEKTQTEVYEDFKQHYPEVKVSQRHFERLKPFFIRPMRTKDRNTCCCRKHVECRLLSNRCKEYMKRYGLKERTYETFGDLVAETMCKKDENSEYFNKECIERECKACGVNRVWMLKEENVSDPDRETTWERYEYVNINIKGRVKRKLMLVKKKTASKELFDYFRSKLHSFTQHQFSANWQIDQLNALKKCLPENTCLVIHDFSENYRCIEKEELQSGYFGKTEVSIHVSVIYRHAVMEYDHADETSLVSELMFCISPDGVHDHYFVSKVQEEIKAHLDEIGYRTERMIEFTDGCSVQYKSKTCMGKSSMMCETMGIKMFQRNYFETSHAKGPQDAAGGLLKRQLDLAVLKGSIIQNAKDVFSYASEHLYVPKSGIYARRIFRFIPSIDRSENYSFRAVEKNLQVHQLTATQTGRISVRDQSCYTCDNCLIGEGLCMNLHMTGAVRDLDIRVPVGKRVFTVAADETEKNSVGVETEDVPIEFLIVAGSIVAVLADDEEQDYFVLKADKSPNTLDEDKTDEWGNVFPRGSLVVSGHYYNNPTVSKSGYCHTLIKKKENSRIRSKHLLRISS